MVPKLIFKILKVDQVYSGNLKTLDRYARLKTALLSFKHLPPVFIKDSSNKLVPKNIATFHSPLRNHEFPTGLDLDLFTLKKHFLSLKEVAK